ncbi:hypothetical protein F4819DRAFT_443185 [Hypoxylon fuscum]|nr:hypothetical protein F4819DRAFT_443185 [Hypoxylon fuscum]
MPRTKGQKGPQNMVIRSSAAMIKGHNQGRKASVMDKANHPRASPKSCFDTLFFKLPYELRLIIYELLLSSQDFMVCSPRRPLYLYGRGNYTRCVLPVELLRTCKQINAEATSVLYGQNRFIVYLNHLDRPCSEKHKKLELAHFFLKSLRESTLSSIKSIRFQIGCRCKRQIETPLYAHGVVNGLQLVSICFPHHSEPHWLPSRENIRKAHEFLFKRTAAIIHPDILNHCMKCTGSHDHCRSW